jgi:hypothetical protein
MLQVMSAYTAPTSLCSKETIMRISKRVALASALAPLLSLVLVHASDADRKRSETSAKDLVVHEWGTFSTFSGSDGKQLKFYPYDNDLPEFVHGYQPRNSKQGPQGGLISLETPVVYFYSPKPLTASVHVDFPKGIFTEWYPDAGRQDTKLDWTGVEVLPKEDLRLLSEKKDSRYYAARETDACPLRVTFHKEDGTHTEQEKLLFYRGVGNFEMPLKVRAQGNGKFTVNWTGPAIAGDLFLIQVKAGTIRFQPFQLPEKAKWSYRAEVQIPTQESSEDKLGEALVERLTKLGLYEKEAKAMVKTWRSAWFGEEGTRVLYFLPTEMTQDFLPMRVNPKPQSLVRVLVGRHDVLTPETERQIDRLVTTVNEPSQEQTPVQRAAWQDLCKLGRYRDAARAQAEARSEHKR